jgi:NAD(P)-dependent dehydrogenase (short-subunit alcohol dehydrogenase family)
VNCSSIGGLTGRALIAANHGTKHGVIGLTRSAALEYATRGVRVNAVCLGTIDTPMASSMLVKGMLSMDDLLRDLPMKRLGRGDEITDAVRWLRSSDSTFFTGQALAVDGGFTVY